MSGIFHNQKLLFITRDNIIKLFHFIHIKQFIFITNSNQNRNIQACRKPELFHIHHCQKTESVCKIE